MFKTLSWNDTLERMGDGYTDLAAKILHQRLLGIDRSTVTDADWFEMCETAQADADVGSDIGDGFSR